MSILENAKDVAKAVHEINNLDLYQRVLNLHSDIIELVEENNRLRDENKSLSEKIRLKGGMRFNAPFYYQEADKTPYCPACWELKKEGLHVVFQWEEGGETHWECPSCKNGYSIKRRSHLPMTDRFGGEGAQGQAGY
jgi:regulator of replication initiation timing